MARHQFAALSLGLCKSMNPLASLALVVLAGLCLVAYLFGYEAGRSAGQDEGHEKGKKEGAVRAFAVGYDRGKREREEDEDDDEYEATGPSWVVFLTIVLATAMLLTLVGVLRQRGLF